METALGEEEEATFNHSRCNLGFQGLVQKTHPNQSWSSLLKRQHGAGGPLQVMKPGTLGAQRPIPYAVLQGSPFNNTLPSLRAALHSPGCLETSRRITQRERKRRIQVQIRRICVWSHSSPLGRCTALQKLQPVPADGELEKGLG